METICLEHLPFKIDAEKMSKMLHISGGSEDEIDFVAMVKEAGQVANPKVMFGVTCVEERSEDQIVLSGIKFDSRVLSRNLENVEKVIPFTATCGMELQDWAAQFTDIIWNYWAEAIKEAALQSALEFLFKMIKQEYIPGHVSTMSPGSLENWPISQQVPLFELLGDTKGRIGVTLTDSLLMVPTKSVSGIVFPRDLSFESCHLCLRTNCPNRRAPYDETLYEREYCPKGGR